MSTALKFNVLPPNSSVHFDGEEFAAGENFVEEPTAELLKLAGSAHAAGVVEVTEGLDLSHIESQEESEEYLVEAMGSWVEPTRLDDGTSVPGYWDGPWTEGHLAAVEVDAVGSSTAEFVVDVEPAGEES